VVISKGPIVDELSSMSVCSPLPVPAWSPPLSCVLCSCSLMGLTPWEVGRHLGGAHHFHNSAFALANIMFRGPSEFENFKKILMDFKTGMDKVESWKQECLVQTEIINNLKINNSKLKEEVDQVDSWKQECLIKSELIEHLKQNNSKLEEELNELKRKNSGFEKEMYDLAEKVTKFEQKAASCHIETQTEDCRKENEITSEENVRIENRDCGEDITILKSPTHSNRKSGSKSNEDVQVIDFKVCPPKPPLSSRCVSGSSLKLKNAKLRIRKLEREVNSLLEHKIRLLEQLNVMKKKKSEADDIVVKFGNILSEIRKTQNASTVSLLDIVKNSIEETKAVLDQKALMNVDESFNEPTLLEGSIEYREEHVAVKQEPKEYDAVLDLSSNVKQEPI